MYFLHDLWKVFCSIKLIWKESVVVVCWFFFFWSPTTTFFPEHDSLQHVKTSGAESVTFRYRVIGLFVFSATHQDKRQRRSAVRWASGNWTFFFFSTSVDRAETTEGLASQRELINNAYNQVSVFFFFFFPEQKRINYWIQLVVWEGFAACLILLWQETEYVWVSGCMSDRISTVWRTSRCPWEEKKKDTMKDILSRKKKSSLKLNSWFLIRGFKLCVEKCQSCHSLNFEDIYLSRSW